MIRFRDAFRRFKMAINGIYNQVPRTSLSIISAPFRMFEILVTNHYTMAIHFFVAQIPGESHFSLMTRLKHKCEINLKSILIH